MAYQKMAPLNYANVTESPTSFCFCIIRDPKISSDPLVLKVLNSADNKHSTDDGRSESGNRDHGKPEGFGEPGGGLNPEELDTIRGASEREVLAETGLKVKTGYIPLIEQRQLIISDKRTGKRIHKIPYEKGREPSVLIDVKNQIPLKNPIYVFEGRVEWNGSKLQNLFHKMKDLNALDDDYTQNYGIYTVFDEDLTPETLASLEIEEARLNEETGTREIEGIGIFPLPMLMEMIDTSNCWFEGLYFYYTHLLRDREIATSLGLLPQLASI